MTHIITSLLWAYLIFFLASFAATNHQLRINNRVIGYSVILLVLIVAVHTPVFTPYWFGIEYEDAFEYIYAGKFIASDSIAQSTGLNSVCLVGNIGQCNLHGSLAHPSGLSILLSYLTQLFGFQLFIGNIVSVISTFISSYLIYIILGHSGITQRIRYLTSGLYLFSAGTIVFGNTSLAEPVSALLIVSTIWATVDILKYQNKSAYYYLFRALFLVSAVILSALVKRESLIIIPSLILFFFVSSIYYIDKPYIRKYLFIVIASVSFSLLVIISFFIDILLNFESVNPSSEASFSFQYISKWGFYYVKVLFSEKYFMLSVPALIGMANITRSPIALISAIYFCGYTMLFISFSQSYYAVMYGEIPIFHFERYSVQILPVIALIAAFGLQRIFIKYEYLLYSSKKSFLTAFFLVSAPVIFSLYIVTSPPELAPLLR